MRIRNRIVRLVSREVWLVWLTSAVLLYPHVLDRLPVGDSGELLVCAAELLQCHPPGYPLFLWLYHSVAVATRTISCSLSVTWRLNLLTSWLAAAFLSLLFVECRLAAAATGFLDGGGLSGRSFSAYVIASVVVAAVAAAPDFIAAAVGTEVFALHLFLSVLVLRSHARLVMVLDNDEASTTPHAPEDRRTEIQQGCRGTSGLKPRQRSGRCLALSTAAAACNQHLSVLVLLPVWLHLATVACWRAPRASALRRFASWSLSAVAMGILGYASLFVVGDPSDPYGWGGVASVSGLVSHMFRLAYGTFRLHSGRGVIAMQTAGMGAVSEVLSRWHANNAAYATWLARQVPYFMIAFALLGALRACYVVIFLTIRRPTITDAAAWCAQQRGLVWVGVWLLSSAGLLNALINLPLDRTTAAERVALHEQVIGRLWLQTLVPCALLASYGAAWVWCVAAPTLVSRSASPFHVAAAVAAVGVCLVGIISTLASGRGTPETIHITAWPPSAMTLETVVVLAAGVALVAALRFAPLRSVAMVVVVAGSLVLLLAATSSFRGSTIPSPFDDMFASSEEAMAQLDSVMEAYGSAALTELEPRAVVVTVGDASLTAIRHAQRLRGVRSDVLHMDRETSWYSWFHQRMVTASKVPWALPWNEAWLHRSTTSSEESHLRGSFVSLTELASFSNVSRPLYALDDPSITNEYPPIKQHFDLEFRHGWFYQVRRRGGGDTATLPPSVAERCGAVGGGLVLPKSLRRFELLLLHSSSNTTSMKWWADVAQAAERHLRREVRGAKDTGELSKEPTILTAKYSFLDVAVTLRRPWQAFAIQQYRLAVKNWLLQLALDVQLHCENAHDAAVAMRRIRREGRRRLLPEARFSRGVFQDAVLPFLNMLDAAIEQLER